MDLNSLALTQDRVNAGFLTVEHRDDQLIFTDARFDPNTGEPDDSVVTTLSEAEVAKFVTVIRERNERLQAQIDDNSARVTFLEGLL